MKATIKEKAKAFDLLLKYHHQEELSPREDYIGFFIRMMHHDQVCRMNTYLKAVQENDLMILDENNLFMDYEIWEEEE